jgi:outer membrane receptor for ferrienterochelin and colicin
MKKMMLVIVQHVCLVLVGNTKRIIFCLLLLNILSASISFAQSEGIDIKGYVVDAKSGEALPYANIAIKGKRIGAATNTEGYFILVNAPTDADTLEVYYIGYLTEVVSLISLDRTKPIIVKMKQSLLETDAITVTAEQYHIWKTASEVSQVTFSPKEISVLPNLGQVDIFRSLQLLPGISGVGDGSSGLYVRGGTPDQNLVLLDGMTVYHVDHFFGIFSAFNADAIKDVQVFKGGYPAKYGGRLSSVVDLTGKTGDLNKTRVGLGINLLSINGILEIPLFNKGSFLLSARRSYTDFIQSGLYTKLYDFITDESNSNNQVAQGPRGRFGGRGMEQEETRPAFYFYDLNAKLSYNPTRKDAFAFSFYSGKDNLDDSQELGDLQLRGTSEEDVFGTRTRQEITDWGNIGASLKWSRQWHDRFNTNILFAASQYFSDYNRDMSFNTDNGGSGLDDSSRVFRGVGNFASEENNTINDLTFRLDSEWHLTQAHRLGFGAFVSQIETDYKATLNDTISLFHRNRQSLQSSLYLQDRWILTDNWNVTLGLRSTFFDQTDQFYLEPRASMVYSLTRQIKLKGAWGQYYQYIHRVTNEDVLEGSRDFWLVADDDFQPSYAEHYIAGISYENLDYLFEIEAFYKDLGDLVEYSRRFQRRADYGELFFFGAGVSKGIEFLAQKKAGVIDGWISYTLSKVDYKFPNLNNSISFPASHDRTHEFKAVATYSLGSWDFSATGVFATGQPYTSPESQYFLEMLNGDQNSYIHVSDKNALRMPDYQRADVSISKHFYAEDRWGDRKMDGWHAEAGLSVYNLLNHKNIWYRKYDLDVTPIVITDVTMLGFTPTIYFRMNF